MEQGNIIYREHIGIIFPSPLQTTKKEEGAESCPPRRRPPPLKNTSEAGSSQGPEQKRKCNGPAWDLGFRGLGLRVHGSKALGLGILGLRAECFSFAVNWTEARPTILMVQDSLVHLSRVASTSYMIILIAALALGA